MSEVVNQKFIDTNIAWSLQCDGSLTRGMLMLQDISPCFMLQMLSYWKVLFNLCLWNAPSSLMQFSRVLIIFDLKFILRSTSSNPKVGQSLAAPWRYAENSNPSRPPSLPPCGLNAMNGGYIWLINFDFRILYSVRSDNICDFVHRQHGWNIF